MTACEDKGIFLSATTQLRQMGLIFRQLNQKVPASKIVDPIKNSIPFRGSNTDRPPSPKADSKKAPQVGQAAPNNDKKVEVPAAAPCLKRLFLKTAQLSAATAKFNPKKIMDNKDNPT